MFDLDGTLTDSGEGIINSAIVSLQHFGLPIPSREELRTFVGPPLTDTFVKFGVRPEDALEAVEVYRQRYIPIGMYENAPYPGIPQLLEALQKEGHTLCIATSKPEGMAAEILEHFGLAKYFHFICGAAIDHSRDTKAQVIAHLLRQCSTSDPMIMVGDTAFDILGAKEHHIPAIGVAWGYGDMAEMKEAGAIAIAHTTEELWHLLKE